MKHKKTLTITFWIRSNKGTDEFKTFKYKSTGNDGFDEDFLDHELERWCCQFGAWHCSGNFVSYGFYEGKRDKSKEK